MRGAREWNARFARPRLGVDSKSGARASSRRMPSSAKSGRLCRAAGSRLRSSSPSLAPAARRANPTRSARAAASLAPQAATPAFGRSASANASGFAKPRARAARRDPLRTQLVQLVRAGAGRGAAGDALLVRAQGAGERRLREPQHEAAALLALGPEPRGFGVGAGAGERGPARHVAELVVDPLELELGARAQEVLEPRALARLAPGLEALAQVGHRRRILGYLARR
jgi:hypothetical protein